MTRLASASVLLGLAFTSSALAQTAPDNDMNDDTPDETGTTNPADTTNQSTGAPGETTSPDSTMPRTDVDVQTTTPTTTPTTDVDINVRTPPDPVISGTTDYVVPPTTTYVDNDDEEYRPLSGVGIALAAGGGASGFVSETLRNSTDVGGDWDVRATIGTRSPLAFEASYIGSAQGISALGLDTDAVLVGNGAQGALRLNGTLNLPVQPFVFAGIGWRRYDLMNADTNLSDVEGSDDVLEVPMGLGIAGKWNGLILDARGEFRATSDEDLLPRINTNETDDQHADMQRWGVKATVGAEF